jgi:hypothetical protein
MIFSFCDPGESKEESTKRSNRRMYYLKGIELSQGQVLKIATWNRNKMY